jgi:tetratricopeptide (TPR) repeat protein
MAKLSRQERFRRLQQLSHGPFPALTILEARRFLREWPTNGPAWLLLGIALIELARYEEAEQSLAKALEFVPTEKRRIPLWHMGHLFLNCGDYDQAVQWYRKAIQASPGDATGYIFLGALLARQGRLHDAEEAYRAGTACDEGCIDEAFLNLGNVLRALERFDAAAECYREAIRIDPNYRIAKQALRDARRSSRFQQGRRRKQR